MAEEKHHHHLFHHRKEEESSGEVDYEKKEKHHKHMEKLGELGAIAASAYALHEKHKAKKDPENEHGHRVKEEVAAVTAVGSAGFAFHGHHEKKDAKKAWPQLIDCEERRKKRDADDKAGIGLPLEQWRGGEADGGKKQAVDTLAAAGCRTPDYRQAGRRAGGDCPAAPQKRRAPAGVVTQQQHRDFYTGDDIEAFFTAHNI